MSFYPDELVFFSELATKQIGKATIKNFPGTAEDASKIWAQIRKRTKKRYGIDVAGSFSSDSQKINCTFNRNSVPEERDPRIYEERFKDTFYRWIEDFRAALEKASLDLAQGYTIEETIYSLFPEKKARDERKKRKIKQ